MGERSWMRYFCSWMHTKRKWFLIEKRQTKKVDKKRDTLLFNREQIESFNQVSHETASSKTSFLL